MDNSVKSGKICSEGLNDHKADRRDYSIPLYVVLVTIVSMIAAI